MTICHLNICSDFSLQESTITIDKIIQHAIDNNCPAMAMTDMSNLFGAVEFYSKCMAKGVKPIVGCTFYVCDNHLDKSAENYKRFTKLPRITLLAKNNEGWKNLMKLSSISYLDGFYYMPRIDKKLLEECSDGLFALSGGFFGEVESHLLKGDFEKAKESYEIYNNIYGQDFFFEVQSNQIDTQSELNSAVINLANENGANIVATNAARFTNEEEFDSFKAVLALKSKRTVYDDILGDYNENFFLRDNDYMEDFYKDIPSAIENTVYIANRCNVDIQFGQYQMPDFELPEGVNITEHVNSLAHAGLEKKWNNILLNNPEADKEVYLVRLHRELETLNEMGFLGYFLVVSDFIQWAKDNEIPVGPGRGSGAGSLVAYSMYITDLDPIKYGLLFERFLNPERVSMPDFDIDFCKERREEVIDYVEEKYGSSKVSQIINFGKMKAKAAIRDVGRVFDIAYEKIDHLAKLIPEDLDTTLTNALEREPRIQDYIDSDEDIKSVYDAALKLEGNHRHAGKHAAGVVIGKNDLVESAPLYKVPGEDGTVVQWDMKSAEKSGLIKFDFLGLKTLTVIDKAVRLIHQQDKDFDINIIPMDCYKTFTLLKTGKTSSVFQLESDGMQRVLVDLEPDCFEDLIALVALYRPGPLESGMVSTYIDVKHGRVEPEYPHPSIESILEETYGVILYQEQVMQIAQTLSGYTLGGADILRRAMGKKDPVEMQKQRGVFVDGAIKNKIDEKLAGDIFDLIEMFAGYGFNKSHSAAYALLTYQTAYLKANYPYEFMCASMTCDSSDDEKLRTLVYDTRFMGIDILYPNINKSDYEFSVSDSDIIAGLCSIKGLGETGARAIVSQRKESLFESVEDLISRCKINKKALEALIKAGALDELNSNRDFMLANIPIFMKKSKNSNKDKDSGQYSIFDVSSASDIDTYEFVEVEKKSDIEQLEYENEVFGFYLGKHPATVLHSITNNLFDYTANEVKDAEIDDCFTVINTVDNCRIIRLDSGNMAILSVSDRHGSFECVCFPRTFSKLEETLEEGNTVVLNIKKNERNDRVSYIVEDAHDAIRYINRHYNHISVTLDDYMASKSSELNDALKVNRKGFDVNINLMSKDGTKNILECNEKRKITCQEALRVLSLGFDIKLNHVDDNIQGYRG